MDSARIKSRAYLSARWDWKLMMLAAIAVVAFLNAKLIGANPATSYGAASALLFSAISLAISQQRWARVVGAGVLWGNIIVFSLLTIPDREQALLVNQEGLNWWSAALALYFLVCLFFLRLPNKDIENVGAPTKEK